MSASLGLRYHYHDVCGVMELLGISIADSNQILIFLDHWETPRDESQTGPDTLYLNSYGTARLSRSSPPIIFILWAFSVLINIATIWACLFTFISKAAAGAAGMFFLILLEYQYTICYSPGSTQQWNCPTNDFIERKRFLLNENQIFFTLHYIEHRGKFYHHFLDFLSLSGLISRFVRSLWPDSSEKEIDINIYHYSMRRIKECGKKGQQNKMNFF